MLHLAPHCPQPTQEGPSLPQRKQVASHHLQPEPEPPCPLGACACAGRFLWRQPLLLSPSPGNWRLASPAGPDLLPCFLCRGVLLPSP